MQMSTRVEITANNITNYTLSLYEQWGGPYSLNPPQYITPKQLGKRFALVDDDRAGVIYLAKDDNGNEMGFAALSYTYLSRAVR